MAITFVGLRWFALDPGAQARFWAAVLDLSSEGDRIAAPGLSIEFVRTDRPKTVQGRIHLDLTIDSAEDHRARVQTVLRLGGRHVDVGQEPGRGGAVLADPEGHELCVIPPGNRFLADTGRVGAINCDGTRDLRVFWSRVLDWPLVWDRDEETAIQSPDGGSKITWSGTPLMERDHPGRIAQCGAAEGPEDLERLAELGARHLDGDRFLDPDGNEIIVASTWLAAR